MKVQPNPHHHPTCKSKVSNVQAACHNCHNKILSALSAWNSRRPIENLAFLFLFLVAARQQLARVRCTLLSVLSTHWDENICFREEKQVCFKMVALAAPGLAIGIKARRTCGLLEMKKLGLQENKCIFKMVGPLLLWLDNWCRGKQGVRAACSLHYSTSPPLLPASFRQPFLAAAWNSPLFHSLLPLLTLSNWPISIFNPVLQTVILTFWDFSLALLSNIKSTSFQNNSLRSERPALTIFLPYIMSDRTYENCNSLLLISGIGIQLHGITSCVGQSDTTVWFLSSESEPRPKIVGIVFQIQSDAFVRFGW